MDPKAKKTVGGTIAAIYARYSSNVQNDASIEQQVAECTDYAKKNKLSIIAVYEDRAISGRSDKRPGFQKMMRAAERGEFQVLLAYKSNRISRNMRNALVYEDRLFQAGVKVVYCKEEFGDNATGRFMLRMMMNVNQFYSENMAEDIRRGMKDIAKKGKVVASIPYGYKKGEDGTYAIDEETAPVVQEIYRRYLNNETFADMARSLNERHIPTKTNSTWGKMSFHSILRNERYTGVYIYDDIRTEGGMPQIIERGVWEMVQRKLADRRATHRKHVSTDDYLLTGKLFCGHCLSQMVGVSGKGKLGTVYHYYSCMGKRLGIDCDKKNIRKDFIEEEVTRAVLECTLEDETIEWIADSIIDMAKQARAESKIEEYTKKLASTKKQIDNIIRAISFGIELEGISEKAQELQEEAKDLEGLIAIEKACEVDYKREDIIGFLLNIRSGDYKNKKFQEMIIRDFIRAVYVYDDHFKISVEFTGQEKTYDRTIKLTTRADGKNSDGVSMNSDRVHHLVLIRTPDPRNFVEVSETGFVITWFI